MDYILSSDTYNASGKTALLKATAVLQMDVTNYVLCDNQAVTLSVDSIEELHSYVPFSSDVDIESRLATVASSVDCDPITVDDDEYVVEKIVKKQFNTRLGQYHTASLLRPARCYAPPYFRAKLL